MVRYLRRAVLGAALLGAVTFISFGAFAQAQQPAQPNPSAKVDNPAPADLETLGRLLGDERIRLWLQKQISRDEEKPTAEDTAPPSKNFQETLQAHLTQLRLRFTWLNTAIAALPQQIIHAREIWALEMGEGETLRSLSYILVFLTIGTLAEFLFWRGTRNLRLRVVHMPQERVRDRLQLLGLRILFSALALAFFALGSIGGFLAFNWLPIVELFVVTYLAAFVVVRFVAILGRLILAPNMPSIRLIPIDTAAAIYTDRCMIALATVGGFGFLTSGAIKELGFAPDAQILLTYGVGFILAILVAAMAWWGQPHLRRLVAQKTNGHSRLAVFMVEAWPILATIYSLLLWGLWFVGWYSLAWTFAIALALPLATIVSRITMNRLLKLSPADDAESTDLLNPYIPALQRSVQAILVILAIIALAAAWGADVFALTNRGSSMASFARALFNTIAAILVADLIWQLARTAIDTRLAAETSEQDDPDGARRNARLQTLLPLLRKFLLIILSAMVGMIVLSALGVDIGPLLAGAGVIGIAIGFGAQALVRDIVSGIFFLVDDAFRVGEYIEIGELRGTVEGISLRSLRLRHHRGAIHTIPFGEMKSLTNYSRDWAIVKLEFRVPFDTDLKLVKKIVKQIGQELLQDPEIGPNIIEPLKSQGVRRMEEYNMVVGVKFTSKPGEQFIMRREAYHRIRDAFDKHGINFASRDVTVRVSPGASEEDVAKAAALAAADLAAEQPKPLAK